VPAVRAVALAASISMHAGRGREQLGGCFLAELFRRVLDPSPNQGEHSIRWVARADQHGVGKIFATFRPRVPEKSRNVLSCARIGHASRLLMAQLSHSTAFGAFWRPLLVLLLAYPDLDLLNSVV
jgi:hypothetical protein